MKESKLYQEILDEGIGKGQRRMILDLLKDRFGAEAAASMKEVAA